MLYRNLSLKAAGKMTGVKNFIHPEKSSQLYELLIVTEGTAHICEDYSRYSVEAGELIILDKNKSYYGYTESDTPVSFYWIFFDGEPCGTDIKLVKCGNDINGLCEITERMIKRYWAYDYPDETFGIILELMFHEIYRIFLSYQKNEYSAPLNEICKWICENCDKSIKATDVAKRFSYNEDYLTRLFKNYYNIGIKNFIDNAKVRYIKKMLQDKDVPLKDIPALCGFTTYRSFLMFFSYHENMTPTQYRKMSFIKNS